MGKYRCLLFLNFEKQDCYIDTLINDNKKVTCLALFLSPLNYLPRLCMFVKCFSY